MGLPLNLHFLGTGNAHAHQLGSSCAVLERDANPILMIDCGPDSVGAYRARYPERLPEALFLTHCHMDHVGAWRTCSTAPISNPDTGAGSSSMYRCGCLRPCSNGWRTIPGC